MRWRRSPWGKVSTAALLLGVGGLGSFAPGRAFPAAARAAVVAAGLIAVGLWLRRLQASSRPTRGSNALQITARTGLSPRCALALVLADGRQFLVAYGDGFVQIHETVPTAGSAPVKAEGRDP